MKVNENFYRVGKLGYYFGEWMVTEEFRAERLSKVMAKSVSGTGDQMLTKE